LGGKQQRNLILDLLALQASSPNNKLVKELKSQIETLYQTSLFKSVLASLEKPLAGKTALALVDLMELFRPTMRFENMTDHQLPTFDYFGQLGYDTYLEYYKMAQVQAVFRQQFFAVNVNNEASFTTPASLQPINEITTGLVDGMSKVTRAAMLTILTYKVGQGPLEAWDEEEVHLPTTTLANLGCDWPDAPIARLQITPAHDGHSTVSIFYLPAIHDPVLVRQHHQRVARLKAVATKPFGESSGFERPWNNEMFLELLEELEAENNEE
jgi:hypothetical protein